MTRTEQYNKAMIENNIDWLISIEKSYDLYGYPPEFVSAALWAMDNGQTYEEALATANRSLQ